MQGARRFCVAPWQDSKSVGGRFGCRCFSACLRCLARGAGMVGSRRFCAPSALAGLRERGREIQVPLRFCVLAVLGERRGQEKEVGKNARSTAVLRTPVAGGSVTLAIQFAQQSAISSPSVRHQRPTRSRVRFTPLLPSNAEPRRLAAPHSPALDSSPVPAALYNCE